MKVREDDRGGVSGAKAETLGEKIERLAKRYAEDEYHYVNWMEQRYHAEKFKSEIEGWINAGEIDKLKRWGETQRSIYDREHLAEQVNEIVRLVQELEEQRTPCHKAIGGISPIP
ncbi:MAG: hypothetical protein AOA65_0901 [Candidatus Bathyarchaeota archaeon BA1]|nr:MAG: hypothetical protein AOA65_0901 [Candidatus Bathyarchaeota archaeon BA1]